MPALVVLAAALLLVAASVRSATRPGHASPDESPLSAEALREAVDRAVREGALRALPLAAVSLIGLAVLLAGLGVLAAGFWRARFHRGRTPTGPDLWSRHPRWRPRDALVVALVWIGLQMAGTAVLPAAWASREHAASWLAQSLANIAAVLVVFAVVVRRGDSLEALGVHRRGVGRSVRVGLKAYLAVAPLYVGVVQAQEFVLRRLRVPVDLQESVDVLLGVRSAATLWAVALSAVLVAPVAEEVLFRGFLQGLLRATSGRRAAILCPALLFAALHQNLFALLPLLVLGLALGAVYDRTRSLAAAATLHAAFNAASVALLLSLRLAAGRA